MALKYAYLPGLSSAALGGLFSVAGILYSTRNTVTTDQLDRKLDDLERKVERKVDQKLKPIITALQNTATRGETNEIRRLLLKKTRCNVW